MEANNEGRKQLNSHEPDLTLRNICPDQLQFNAALLTNDSNGVIRTDTGREYNNGLSLPVSGVCSASKKTYQHTQRRAPRRTNPTQSPSKARISPSLGRHWDYMLCAIYCQLPKTIKLTLMATTWPLYGQCSLSGRAPEDFYDLIHRHKKGCHSFSQAKCHTRAQTRALWVPIKFTEGKVKGSVRGGTPYATAKGESKKRL